jgi:hypothetical protein
MVDPNVLGRLWISTPLSYFFQYLLAFHVEIENLYFAMEYNYPKFRNCCFIILIHNEVKSLH